MFTQSRGTYSAYDSRSPRFHINKESESASLLIPSAGRDKLSPLMKSFHRLHAGRARARERESLSMRSVHTPSYYVDIIKQDLALSGAAAAESWSKGSGFFLQQIL